MDIETLRRLNQLGIRLGHDNGDGVVRPMKLGLLASAFNPLHAGHLWAIRQAIDAGACDRVVAAVQIDPTLDRPGKRKPIWPVATRAAMLDAVPGVESVAIYADEKDLRDWIKILRPAVLIVGEDHRGHQVTGSDLVPIFWAKRRPEWSSTRIVDDIYRHATEVLANRHRDAVVQLQGSVQSWLDAKCPCRFPEWDGTQGLGNESTMQEFGGSIGGQHLIRNFGGRDAEQTSESLPCEGNPAADPGVQG